MLEERLRSSLGLASEPTTVTLFDHAVLTGVSVIVSAEVDDASDAVAAATQASEIAIDMKDTALRDDAAIGESYTRCKTAFDGGRRDALLVILTVFQLIPARLTPAFLEWAQTVAEANGVHLVMSETQRIILWTCYGGSDNNCECDGAPRSLYHERCCDFVLFW